MQLFVGQTIGSTNPNRAVFVKQIGTKRIARIIPDEDSFLACSSDAGFEAAEIDIEIHGHHVGKQIKITKIGDSIEGEIVASEIRDTRKSLQAFCADQLRDAASLPRNELGDRRRDLRRKLR